MLAYLLAHLLAYLLACLYTCLFACLLAYLLACLLAYLLACLLAYLLACLLTYLLAYLIAYLLTYLLACLLTCLFIFFLPPLYFLKANRLSALPSYLNSIVDISERASYEAYSILNSTARAMIAHSVAPVYSNLNSASQDNAGLAQWHAVGMARAG